MDLRQEIENIREKLIEVIEILSRNTATLERNTEDMREHIRRTQILEEQMQTALLPIKMFKVLGIIVSVVAAAATIYMAIK
jgi:hypothetical protein